MTAESTGGDASAYRFEVSDLQCTEPEPEPKPRVRLAQRTRTRLSHIHERAQFMTFAIVYSSKRLSLQGLELIFSFLSVHPLGNDEIPAQEKLSLDFGPRWNLLLFSFMFSPN